MCFGMHRFVITANGSAEWVQPVASLLPSPVSNTVDAAVPLSTELGGRHWLSPSGCKMQPKLSSGSRSTF